MPKTKVEYWPDDFVFIEFKDVFDTGIRIKLALRNEIFFCPNCELVEDMDNLDVKKKLCFKHNNIMHRQTEISDFA